VRRAPQVVAITPGKTSPTVSKLDAEGWCAVSSLVLKKNVSEVMDQLEAQGATDILVFDMANSRM
jgi:ATP phosphoribosyltransferase